MCFICTIETTFSENLQPIEASSDRPSEKFRRVCKIDEERTSEILTEVQRFLLKNIVGDGEEFPGPGPGDDGAHVTVHIRLLWR